MKKLLQQIIILCLISLSWHTVFAYDCKVDGIYYNLSGTDATVTYYSSISSSNKTAYRGSITIPSTITYSGKTYSVTSIGKKAFERCSFLTSVNIPNGVTSIGENAFLYCSDLTAVNIPNSVTSIGVNAFLYCSGLTAVNIPNSVTSIEFQAFASCSGLTSVSIPNSVTSIGNSAFCNCSGLTAVNIPNSVTSIGYGAFGGCSGLTAIDIPCSVTSIGDYAFGGCSGLTSVSIPNSVTSIGEGVFKKCSSLTAIDIPNSVTSIEKYAFDGCSHLTSVNIPNGVTSIGESAFYGCSGLTAVTLPDNLGYIGWRAFNGNNKIFVKRGTKSLLACWRTGYTPFQMGTDNLLAKPYVEVVSTTQTKYTMKVNNVYSEYTYKDNRGNTITREGQNVTMTGLKPEASYSYDVKVSLGEFSYTTPSVTATTQNISPTISSTGKTASSVSAKGSYIEGDANVTSQKLTVNGESVARSSMTLTGLDPNRTYKAKYAITVTDGRGETYTYTSTANLSTTDLTIETSQPKVISAGNVIVAAESNLDDEETNVGFEWRRTDWGDDFASNTGSAYLYEGTIEGYIRNLYTEKLWKFRPYYLSNSGTYYYGDWMGIDPTNTSYFEPTVHTYARTTIEGNTAIVRGYALRGTDNVTVQGFMYWRQVNEAKERGDAQHRAPAIPKDAMTVEASGRVMEAQLTGLDYGTTYCYVAFVKTSEGETFYGETQTFTTDVDVTGIEGIAADFSTAEPATVVARYNLNGQCITTPQRGVNILRMSDGTSRKVLVK